MDEKSNQNDRGSSVNEMPILLPVADENQSVISLKSHDLSENLQFRMKCLLDELLNGVAHTILLAQGCVLLRHFGTDYLKRVGSNHVYFSPRMKYVLKAAELVELEADPVHQKLIEIGNLASVKFLLQEFWRSTMHDQAADWKKMAQLVETLDGVEAVDLNRFKMVKEVYNLAN